MFQGLLDELCGRGCLLRTEIDVMQQRPEPRRVHPNGILVGERDVEERLGIDLQTEASRGQRPHLARFQLVFGDRGVFLRIDRTRVGQRLPRIGQPAGIGKFVCPRPPQERGNRARSKRGRAGAPRSSRTGAQALSLARKVVRPNRWAQFSTSKSPGKRVSPFGYPDDRRNGPHAGPRRVRRVCGVPQKSPPNHGVYELLRGELGTSQVSGNGVAQLRSPANEALRSAWRLAVEHFRHSSEVYLLNVHGLHWSRTKMARCARPRDLMLLEDSRERRDGDARVPVLVEDEDGAMCPPTRLDA